MITLPHVTQQSLVDKPGAPESQISDGEEIPADFLQLVRAAKTAGLKPDVEEAVLRKVAVKNDSIKLTLEQVTEKLAAEPQDALAALLAPQGKTLPVTKTLLTASDKTDEGDDPDLQAITALFAMLPQQELSTRDSPVATDKLPARPPVTAKGLDITLTANPQSAATQTVDTDKSRPLTAENVAAGRFVPADAQTNLKVVDNQIPLSPPVSSSAPVISTGAPLTVPATPILNSQLGSQEWQQQLSQQIMLFTRQGQQHAELRLHPEHLGKVEISLKLDDNQLQLQIMSPHSHVRAAIEAALPMLRTSLNESGVQLSQSQVSDEGSMPQQQTPQQEQQNARQSGTFTLESPEDDTPLAVSETLERLAQNKGAVDIFA
ncbi:flagellar hook-length control protein FliK [Klebsiella sp. BIGb0407]|uniref:flagellar hook-length control protein FliK n=1 Tax=Klebsiella sp. BIGb0407 TaxID=2940603 RepID=UPI002167CC54|nr:flagellar hook-length control protein FliK [Klebsiella sp. BIGb0407]MCS3431517.1 flagellar hook-length control protein FliK [Klebsiella sp. BIGb0407]